MINRTGTRHSTSVALRKAFVDRAINKILTPSAEGIAIVPTVVARRSAQERREPCAICGVEEKTMSLIFKRIDGAPRKVHRKCATTA